MSRAGSRSPDRAMVGGAGRLGGCDGQPQIVWVQFPAFDHRMILGLLWWVNKTIQCSRSGIFCKRCAREPELWLHGPSVVGVPTAIWGPCVYFYADDPPGGSYRSQEQDKVCRDKWWGWNWRQPLQWRLLCGPFYGQIRGTHGRIALFCRELNWHKIHFIADVFPNLSNVVCWSILHRPATWRKTPG